MARITVSKAEELARIYSPKDKNTEYSIIGTPSSLMSGPSFYINDVYCDYQITGKAKDMQTEKLEKAQKMKEPIEVKIANYNPKTKKATIASINFNPA